MVVNIGSIYNFVDYDKTNNFQLINYSYIINTEVGLNIME